jgi:hypothetical protein
MFLNMTVCLFINQDHRPRSKCDIALKYYNGITIETHCYRLPVVNQNETKLVEFLVSQNAISLLLINGVQLSLLLINGVQFYMCVISYGDLKNFQNFIGIRDGHGHFALKMC